MNFNQPLNKTGGHTTTDGKYIKKVYIFIGT
jgi:hypothetical protein